MSLHYEWTMSLRLRRDVPEEFLAELRFHLGLADRLPAAPELPYPDPVFALARDDALPGGGVTALRFQRPYPDRPGWWGLHVRTFTLDDSMYDFLLHVPPWLARQSATHGWIGFAREELDINPWLHFYASGGYAYAAGPGEEPRPLDGSAPAFTARQTREDDDQPAPPERPVP